MNNISNEKLKNRVFEILDIGSSNCKERYIDEESNTVHEHELVRTISETLDKMKYHFHMDTSDMAIFTNLKVCSALQFCGCFVPSVNSDTDSEIYNIGNLMDIPVYLSKSMSLDDTRYCIFNKTQLESEVFDKHECLTIKCPKLVL